MIVSLVGDKTYKSPLNMLLRRVELLVATSPAPLCPLCPPLPKDAAWMPHMGYSGDISAQEREENAIAQDEELEALEAIYGEACEIVSRGSAASCHKVFIKS